MMTPIISVAPMMHYTDQHARYFFRLIAPNVRLYTEMIPIQALMYGDPHRLINDLKATYVALQLGGNDPKMLAKGAKLGAEFGYKEINFNVGCPSNRVRAGQFGACLMLSPKLVADCVRAMSEAVDLPITVKCRTGVDHHDTYDHLYQFISKVSEAGCDHFIIHARKAWLSGLNPKQNRKIPALCYERVNQIKQDFPHLTIILNGGLQKLQDLIEHGSKVDGAMIGRAAYANPYLLADIEKYFYNNQNILTREKIVQKYSLYIKNQMAAGVKFSILIKPILGLYKGQMGAKKWRRSIGNHSSQVNSLMVIEAFNPNLDILK